MSMELFKSFLIQSVVTTAAASGREPENSVAVLLCLHIWIRAERITGKTITFDYYVGLELVLGVYYPYSLWYDPL